jgi:Domain of unknown function (DUF4190)
MTESSDTPSDRRENTQGPPQTGPFYPYQHQYQPGPYPGGYPPPPQPYYGYPPPLMGPRNGLGIASLVLAIVALLSFWSVAGGIILGIPAVVIGFVARGRVKQGEANNGGVAIAGIVLGALAVIVELAFIAILALWIAVWKDVGGGGDYISCMQKAGSNQFKQQQCADQFRENVQDRLSVTQTPTPVP